MKITIEQLKKMIKEVVEIELKKENLSNFARTISGKDEKYFEVLNDLMSNSSQALAHEDFLNQNKNIFLNKSSYQPNGALYKAALNAVEAENKAKGVKGYGQGVSLNDLVKAVVNGYKLLSTNKPAATQK